MSSDERERLALLGEIALEVAHELRNLLLVIDGSTYLAKKDPSGDHLDKIDRSVRAARAVVDDVFLLARDEPLPMEELEAAELFGPARAEFVERAAEWVDAVAEGRFRAHDRLIARLLKVLYENAIAIRRGERPRIETRVAFSGDSVLIDVEDDGPGVPPDRAASIFEPFVSTREGGTGMGLPLARRIAAAHGGTIELVRGQGEGACFRVTLPRRTAAT